MRAYDAGCMYGCVEACHCEKDAGRSVALSAPPTVRGLTRGRAWGCKTTTGKKFQGRETATRIKPVPRVVPKHKSTLNHTVALLGPPPQNAHPEGPPKPADRQSLPRIVPPQLIPRLQAKQTATHIYQQPLKIISCQLAIG